MFVLLATTGHTKYLRCTACQFPRRCVPFSSPFSHTLLTDLEDRAGNNIYCAEHGPENGNGKYGDDRLSHSAPTGDGGDS
jgi:hypothetical protein